MYISTVRGLYHFVTRNSGFSGRTVHSVILSLGYYKWGTKEDFLELSCDLQNCSNYGANIGFSGFTYYQDTLAFSKKHRHDIVKHMEKSAAELGTDIISMVQNFGVFRNSEKPTASEIGKALWGSPRHSYELVTLYNVCAWYALEEIAHTWQKYLEAHPALEEKLSA